MELGKHVQFGCNEKRTRVEQNTITKENKLTKYDKNVSEQQQQ